MRSRLQKVWKNQKGMTLVELLAVIVILAIITAIAVPSIGGIINNTKKSAHISNGLMVINAAKVGIAGQDSKLLNLDKDGTGKFTVTVQQLNNFGYLDTVPSDPSVKGKKYNPTASTVTIEKNGDSGKYSYSVVLYPAGDTTTPYVDNSEDGLNNGKAIKK